MFFTPIHVKFNSLQILLIPFLCDGSCLSVKSRSKFLPRNFIHSERASATAYYFTTPNANKNQKNIDSGYTFVSVFDSIIDVLEKQFITRLIPGSLKYTMMVFLTY
jgi:hypothetical protein